MRVRNTDRPRGAPHRRMRPRGPTLTRLSTPLRRYGAGRTRSVSTVVELVRCLARPSSAESGRSAVPSPSASSPPEGRWTSPAEDATSRVPMSSEAVLRRRRRPPRLRDATGSPGRRVVTGAAATVFPSDRAAARLPPCGLRAAHDAAGPWPRPGRNGARVAQVTGRMRSERPKVPPHSGHRPRETRATEGPTSLKSQIARGSGLRRAPEVPRRVGLRRGGRRRPPRRRRLRRPPWRRPVPGPRAPSSP